MADTLNTTLHPSTKACVGIAGRISDFWEKRHDYINDDMPAWYRTEIRELIAALRWARIAGRGFPIFLEEK